MNLKVTLLVFALLQLVVAIAEDEDATKGLRGASKEDDRQLRPFGYPAPPNRPGQSQRYGLNSLLGYRPFTNAPRPQPNYGYGYGRGGRYGPQRPQDVDGDGIPDGALVIGVSRNPTLAERLGYFRVDAGTQNVFIQGGPTYDEEAPTPAPEPTISPAPTTKSPTSQPTINPTRRPTEAPTLRPTPSPTLSPTPRPTNEPTKNPTGTPTVSPTRNPTGTPTRNPTATPTVSPTRNPTATPTRFPTPEPTRNPTRNPTRAPTPASF